MKPLRLFLLLLGLAALAIPLAAGEENRVNETRVLMFYDSTREAHYLWPYRFRVLVVEDLAGSGGACWRVYPNGSHLMDPEVCRPLSNARLRVWYAELKESREVITGPTGIAEVEWRIFTYPRATFRVELESRDYVVERNFAVQARPWTLAAVASFSAMMSAMVYALRRGVW